MFGHLMEIRDSNAEEPESIGIVTNKSSQVVETQKILVSHHQQVIQIRNKSGSRIFLKRNETIGYVAVVKLTHLWSCGKERYSNGASFCYNQHIKSVWSGKISILLKY